MTISRNDWNSYIKRLSAINKTAANKMSEYVALNGYGNIDNIIQYAYSLTSCYGEAASALACEMYEGIALAQGFRTTAIPAETYSEEYVAGTMRKLVDESPVQIPNAVSRMVKQAGADTILQNAQRDGAEFAWIPNGDTCAFCMMLASNGWQRASKAAINGGHAEHIHSNCDCTYAVRFDGKSNVAGYNADKYLEKYENASDGDWKDKLNAMRREQYAENKDEINEQKREAYALRKENNVD